MAVKTKAELQAEIDQKLADNVQGDISAQDVREVATDLTDSASFGAFELGPEQNTFVAADRAAAEAVRDTYEIANQDWLALYNSNRANNIGLAEDVKGPYFAFQRRNVDGDDWEDVTGVVRGGQGSRTDFLTAVPADTDGDDGDTALVRLSSIVVHAFEKVAGAWVRQWAFSGGDSVLLASGAAVPDRLPAADPTGRYIRKTGISAYAPVLIEDIDHANATRATPQSPLEVNSLAAFRGGLFGTTQNSRANALNAFALSYTFSVEVYVWFAIRPTDAPGLEITEVSQGGVDVPIVYQGEADYLDFSGVSYRLYRTVSTYTQAQIDADTYELTVIKDPAAPETFNRYAVVTASDTPTEADFLSTGAKSSQTIRVLIPNVGWGTGRGYLHFALPATQDAPTIAGQAGGINLIDDFTVRSTVAAITINGDSMRTISSKDEVFQMTDAFNLFPWIVR